MPAYNEEDNIEDVVRSWYSVLSVASEDSKLVVADSGSKDNTHKILLELQKELQKIIVLSDTIKTHGPKLIALYRYAIDNDASWIFQTDSDGQTDPKEFYEFWNLKEKYDAVLGERKVRGDGLVRKFIENVVCFLLRIIFNVNVLDANAPFRLIKKDLLSKYIGRFSEDYNLPNIMLTTFFKYYNENIVFREITFKPRSKGTNSINILKIIKIGLKAIIEFIDFKKQMMNRKNIAL